MNDNKFYPFAIRALNQSLLLYAEVHSTENKVIQAIAVDHALFHLTMFLLLTTPDLAPENLKTQLINRVEQLVNKSSPILDQLSFDRFIEKLNEYDLPASMNDFFQKWKKLRDFVNYGFPIRFTKGGIEVSEYEHLREDLLYMLKTLDRFFAYAVKIACESSPGKGRIIIAALGQSKKFFTAEDSFYAKYCSEGVLKKAESLRRKLFALVKLDVIGAERSEHLLADQLSARGEKSVIEERHQNVEPHSEKKREDSFIQINKKQNIQF